MLLRSGAAAEHRWALGFVTCVTVVTYADDRRDERPVVGRSPCAAMIADAIVVPPFADVLAGQIVLEFLNLVAGCHRRTFESRMPGLSAGCEAAARLVVL